MHILDSLMYELQSLSIVKQTVDDITDKIIELERALASLQFTADRKGIYSEDKQKEKEPLKKSSDKT